MDPVIIKWFKISIYNFIKLQFSSSHAPCAICFQVTGLGICVEVIKNKLAPAMKKAALEIEFGRGISRASEVLELACEHGVVLKERNCYFIDGKVVNGKMEAESFLIQNEIICEKLVKTLRRQFFRIDEHSES